MKYFSSNRKSLHINFKEATIKGLAPDKGLYFPEYIPQADKGLISDIENYSNAEIAYNVISPYVGDSIPSDELKRIAAEAIDFDIPLVKVTSNIYSLELFHGPTLAFKDVGARFMSRCLGYFAKEIKQKIIVLVATSGDTGGAVANGFYKVDGVDVVILYPSGKVSSVQEKQMTTLGNNIHALEVEGNFDDCQQMVKDAFTDKNLNEKLFLTSANSINIARWLPQQFYYYFAWKQWEDKNNPPVISVPSGNFGNICAGLLANHAGLPVKHFIAACNANDTVPEYFKTGKYAAKKAVATLSNAMDVGDPSNFARILELFNHNIDAIKKKINTCSISDEEVKKTIKEVFAKENYILDPHAAVAYKALQDYFSITESSGGIILETAHPVKFFDVVESVIQQKVPVPDSVQNQMNKDNQRYKIPVDSNMLKSFLNDL